MARLSTEAPLVLIVDDEEVARRDAAEILESLDLRVRTAASGEDAIRIFARELPAMILMDVRMPGFDGIETLRRIRALSHGDRVPVLMITGCDDEDEIRRGFEAGATDFIRKPFQWQILGQRIRHMVRAAGRSRALVHAWEEVLLATERETGVLKRLDYEVRHFVMDVLAELGAVDARATGAITETTGAPESGGSTQIREAAEQLLGFLDEALDFSRVRSGQVRLTSRGFSLETFISSLAEDFRARACAKGLSLICRVEPSTPVRIVGDERRLRHVLSQLVENAIHHTEAGEVTMSARVIGTGEGAVTIEFVVQDTGVGFSAELADRAFDVYTREGEAGDDERVGLGLYLASRIVKLMGDNLRLETELGKGSKLRFALKFPTEVPEVPRPPVVPDPMQVLVVDDQAGTRAFVVFLLEANGHTVREASGGAEAVRQFELHRPDAILMDVEMPNVDGLEATRRIRALEAEGEHVPIIALTSHVLAEHQMQCAKAGMDSHLGKPFEIDDLLERLRQTRALAKRPSPR